MSTGISGLEGISIVNPLKRASNYALTINDSQKKDIKYATDYDNSAEGGLFTLTQPTLDTLNIGTLALNNIGINTHDEDHTLD